jgi:hypothetical protein
MTPVRADKFLLLSTHLFHIHTHAPTSFFVIHFYFIISLRNLAMTAHAAATRLILNKNGGLML